jgi:hypothetical protein
VRAVLVFFVALFDARAVLPAALERRALAFLPDFAFAERAALLLAADRDGREAAAEPATTLRLRDGADAADALLFLETVLDVLETVLDVLETVLDDFLFAFFRAAMAKTLQTQDKSLPA